VNEVSHDTPHERFPSRRDPQLVTLLRRATWGFLLGGGALLVLGAVGGGDIVVVLAVVALALGVACAWTLRATWYECTLDRLRIRSGPSRMAIRWENVLRIVPSQDRRNAPALSYDRLRIDYRHGKSTRTVLVSPRNMQAFLDAIRRRTELVQREGGGLERPSEGSIA